VHAARELSRKCKKTIQINRYIENKIAILREPILPAWQCSCKERRKQSALARWAKDHPACESSVCPAWRLPTNPMFILLGGCSRGQYSPCLARTQFRIVHGKIPSPACGGRGSHEKNARIFFMGTREGGRRPEGVIQNQDLSRLTVSTSTMTLRRKENVETLPATSQKTRSSEFIPLIANALNSSYKSSLNTA